MALSFLYCECGCHGHECNPAPGISFWIDMNDHGRFMLHRGHGRHAPLIDYFKTFEDAIQAATIEVRELSLKLLKATLEE